MFTKILVAHDGSDHGWKALAAGLAVAVPGRASVHVVSVREKLPVYAATVGEVMEASGEIKAFFDDLTARVAAEAEKAGVSVTVRILSGHEVQTIEGLEQNGELDVLQKKFIEHGAIQCGYCSPGMILSGRALLNRNAHPTEQEVRKAISGNLCRCTGYVKIVEAIMAAAEAGA